MAKPETEAKRRAKVAAYAIVPKCEYQVLAGPDGKPRPQETINGQADRYGIPLRGPTIDLRAVLTWVHDAFASGHFRPQGDGDDPMLAGGVDSPALERFRDARASLAELDLLERQGVLIPRDEAHAGMVRVAGILRGFGEQQRLYGPDAVEALDAVLDDLEREISRSYGDSGASGI